MKADNEKNSNLTWSFDTYPPGSRFITDATDRYTLLLFLSGKAAVKASGLGNIQVGKRQSVLIPSKTTWSLHTDEYCNISSISFDEFQHPYCKAYLRQLYAIQSDINYSFSPLYMCEAMVDFAESIRLYVKKKMLPDRTREYDLLAMLSVYYQPKEVAGFLYPYLKEKNPITTYISESS